VNALLALALPAAYLWVFWLTYILVMGLYRAHLAGRLTGVPLWLASPVIVLGLLLDVLANIFLATLIFLELPGEWLVTSRLAKYIKRNHGWQSKMAWWVCTHLLDPFDPNGVHCVESLSAAEVLRNLKGNTTKYGGAQ
jgi:hypothetical protein